MERRMRAGVDDLTARMRHTLEEFRLAQQRRMARLEGGDAGDIGEAMRDEREAIYSHSEAIRQHIERLARSGM